MLTFLNTVVLVGLAGVALPVLIHLFARQKSRRVLFSTTTFLKHIHSERMPRFRLRQLILLILRCLAIFFIVLAFARPTIRTGVLTGKGRSSEM